MSVRAMCAAAQVSRAGYYRFVGRVAADPDLELRSMIQKIALSLPTYGYRRVQAELKRRGHPVNHKPVQRLMREDNLLCLRRRSFVCTTDSGHGFTVYPNLARGMVLTAEPAAFADLVHALRQKPWVVYAKRPFSSPEKVLDYLGRYTQRVALSNNRILSLTESADGPQVTFSYRDRKDGNRTRTMTLQVDEFMRRFLLHVLPAGFMRIRHFGFLANRSRKQKLDRCRVLLDLEQPSPTGKKSARQLMLEVTGCDLARCPACHVGTLVLLASLPAIEVAPYSTRAPPLDSS